MSELEEYIDKINKSTNSLKTLYFRPPGIFTNALTTNSDVLSSLRDAEGHENALYQIDPQGRPERKDGTRGVVDHLNEELDEIALVEDENEDEESVVVRPPAVIMPKKVEQPVPDHNKGVKNLMSLLEEENEKQYDVDVLCETVERLLDQYPVEGIREQIQGYKAQWEKLNNEIMSYEETLEKQRRQLSRLDVSLDDDGGVQASPKPKMTVSEMIAFEEANCRRLERELEEQTASTV